MQRLTLALCLLVLATPAFALNVVNTSAPAVNCVFSPTCSIAVTDMSSPLFTNGKLQSRWALGQAGSPAAGKYVYMYRVDMTNVVGITYIPYVTSFSISTPNIQSYDYNFDSVATDHVFVITSGGMGTIGLSSANQWWWSYPTAYFNFSTPVEGGGSPGTGKSSYFFGLVSTCGPRVQYGTVQTNSGAVSVTAFAPYCS